jgi:hypothetical protein
MIEGRHESQNEFVRKCALFDIFYSDHPGCF